MSEEIKLSVRLTFCLLILICESHHSKTGNRDTDVNCGALTTATKGVIQTPGFPKRFPVPIKCRWVIDASAHPDKNVVVYLTQLYVTTGLKFTDYVYYENEGGLKYSENVGHIVTPENVTSSPWIRSFAPYLMIEFELDRLEGNHLRFLDDKHNVYFMYGFNITFELIGRESPVRESCNARLCSLLGECYASKDFTRYECSCFQGFSEPNCAQGPLCEKHTCKNGGTCVHSSAVSFGCKCAEGFAGSKCEFPLKLACDGKDCNQTECFYEEVSEPTCDCDVPLSIPTDRARYEGIIHMSNATHFGSKNGIKFLDGKNKSFDVYLEKLVARYLRASNVSKVERLKVLNYTYAAANFHFYGSKKDEKLIREALRRLMDREEGALGLANVTIYRDATLLIESVVVSKKSIRVGQEFSISCIAQGSVHMTFTWLKDGASINESVITRSVSMHLIYLSRGRYQYTLVIDKASLLDEGTYTCHVSDWHVQQCKGLRVHVAGPPEIRLTPMSATVEKGANLDIVCIPLNNRPKQEKFGYSWIKNRQLLKMTAGSEVWEDLYLSHYNGGINTGSVLEITNIQKSATYTCLAQGFGASSELSVRVEVVNKSVVPLCHAEGKYGVAWQTTAPGMIAIADCPFHALGHARRECRLTDVNTTQWEVPDFTECLSPDLESIYNNFTRLTIGYDVTNGSVTLARLLNAISKRSSFLPGECERIIDMLNHILKYLNASSLFEDLENSAGPFYNVINILLSHERCFITDEKVVLLQNLVKSKGIVWGSLFVGSTSVFQDMNSLVVEVAKLKSDEAYSFYFPPKHKSRFSWLTDTIDVRVDTPKLKVPSQESLTLVVAVYRNLTQFLKTRYLTKYDDGTEQEFEMNSRVVAVVLGRQRYKMEASPDSIFIDMELQHFAKDRDPELWTRKCGVAEFAGFQSTWDLNSCTSQLIGSNVTRCRCKRTGTFAVLLVARNGMMTAVSKENKHFVVLIGCSCCLIQSLLTLCLLMPYWCRRKNCLVFLKMQCCLATACSMSVFIYSVHHSISKTAFPLVTTFLEIFLLVGLSSHLSKLLVIYTEIINLRNKKHMKESVVIIITGLPVLTVLCNFLSYHTTGWNLHSWWIIEGSMVFNVFITSACVLVVLFTFLYVSVLRKLHLLSRKCSEKNKAIFRRIGLLKRAGIVFVTMTLMESASIFYINFLDIFSQYFFSSSSALLGFVIMFCYILKSECSFREKFENSGKNKSHISVDDFISESIISPLKFFTKQDADSETEAIPPPRSDQKRRCELRSNSDHFLLSETKLCKKNEEGNGTLETYISSFEGSIEDRIQGKLHLDASLDSTPPSFAVSELNLNKHKEQDLCSSMQYETHMQDSWKCGKGSGLLTKPNVAHSYIRESPPATSQEIITTRVCVELGVITTHQKNEQTGKEVHTPSIVLCSVDVEPCQSRLVEMNETGIDAVCCNRGNKPVSFLLDVAGQDTESMLCWSPLQSDNYTESKVEDCIKSEKAEDLSLSECDLERRQPEGVEVKDNMEGMLDRISHDLDYLLNRKPNIPRKEANERLTLITEGQSAEIDKNETKEVDTKNL